jgi:hypothetical protein
MRPGGWIFMIVSIAFVVSLTAWCYYRVLTTPGVSTEPPETLGG